MLRRESAFRRSVVLTVIALATVFAVAATADAARVAPCNGSAELCDRPFNTVTLPGSHNAMSNAEQEWSMPNQTIPIPAQLRQGARAMLIDAHYGRPDPASSKPRVVNVTASDYDPAKGDRVYLCHAICVLGASELTGVLSEVRSFLASNPREVLLFIVEECPEGYGCVKPRDFAGAVDESGLGEFVYRGPTTGPGGWPTLAEMIRTDQRVVFLGESQTGGDEVPWYHRGYSGTLQETHYSWPANPNDPARPNGLEMLTDPALLPGSCAPNRGGTNGPLFLMNHWVSGTPGGAPGKDNLVPDPAMAAITNRKEALVARARACEQVRGFVPTILAVDFFGAGDEVGAARELNGVAAAPYLEFRQRPKRAAVKAGRNAVYRLRLANLGDAVGNPKVCAVAPKRLGFKRCARVAIQPGSIRAVRLKVKTRGRAKGKGKVRFTVTGAGDRLTATAQLKVKPKRKKKHHKRR